jgi:hypothetical protein
VVEQFRSFLELCKDDLREETYSQISLLLSMLLEHIIEECRLQSLEQLHLGLIHEHIPSFFDFINKTSTSVDLSSFDIFSDLNTVKTLIVFFNWLGRSESLCSPEPSCCPS